MAKIPFDIKFRPQIESGEYKVETRDGRPASIICWGCQPEDYPLVALISQGKYEDNRIYTIDGRYYSDQLTSVLDLFLITPEPEVELSEFEKRLSDVVGYAISLSVTEPQKPTSEFVKEYAAELLELAKKELCESGEVTDWYAKGKAEALKDLPRWVKVEEGVLLDKYSKYLLYSNGVHYFCCGTTITRDGYMLLVDDLEKLPKEE